MTKCIVLGEKVEETEKKQIKFVCYVIGEVKNIKIIDEPGMKPKDFKFVELVTKGNGGVYDVMIAHHGDRSDYFLYLGHWNDGVAE